MTSNSNKTYQERFLEDIFKKLHNHKISKPDYTGLAEMLNPIEDLANTAAVGLNFNDEPADFLRVLNEVKYNGQNQ